MVAYKTREFVGGIDWQHFVQVNDIKRVVDTCGITAYNEDNGDILAMLICDTWYRDSVHLHLAVYDSIVGKYGFKVDAFKYVFENPEHPETKIAYGFVPDNNVKALRLCKGLGLEEACKLSGGTDGIGFTIMTLTKEQYENMKGVNNGRT